MRLVSVAAAVSPADRASPNEAEWKGASVSATQLAARQLVHRLSVDVLAGQLAMAAFIHGQVIDSGVEAAEEIPAEEIPAARAAVPVRVPACREQTRLPE